MKSLNKYIFEKDTSFVDDFEEMLLGLLQTHKQNGTDPDDADLVEMTQEFIKKHFNDDGYFEK